MIQIRFGWISKTYLPFANFPELTLFFYKYFRFSSLKRSKIRSHATSNNTFRSVVWTLQQENKFMLPARFEQATIWLAEIDNSKPRRLAVCSGEERGLISWTAAGNRAHLPVWHKSLNHPQCPRGHSLIWPIRVRTADQGMVFKVLSLKQDTQFHN